VRVTPDDRMRSDDVGVIYWQAPEIRKGEYDVMFVDIWSLGATVWELIEGKAPFEGQAEVGDRLPELSSSEVSSEALLDFLEMCSSPPHYRPPAQKLLEVCRLSNRRPLLLPIPSTDTFCQKSVLAI
jgi:serine/threonine protein kinase